MVNHNDIESDWRLVLIVTGGRFWFARIWIGPGLDHIEGILDMVGLISTAKT